MKYLILLLVIQLFIPLKAQVPQSETRKEYPKANVDYNLFVELAEYLKPYRESRLVDFNEWLEMAKDDQTIILDTRSKEAYEAVHIEGAIHLDFSDFTSTKLKKILPKKNIRLLIYCNNNFTGDKSSSLVAPGRALGLKGLAGPRTPPTEASILARMGAIGPAVPATAEEIKAYKPSKEELARMLKEELVEYERQLEDDRRNYNKEDAIKKSKDGIFRYSSRTPVALNIPTFINLYYYGYENIYELSSLVDLKDSRLKLEGTEIDNN